MYIWIHCISCFPTSLKNCTCGLCVCVCVCVCGGGGFIQFISIVLLYLHNEVKNLSYCFFSVLLGHWHGLLRLSQGRFSAHNVYDRSAISAPTRRVGACGTSIPTILNFFFYERELIIWRSYLLSLCYCKFN